MTARDKTRTQKVQSLLEILEASAPALLVALSRMQPNCVDVPLGETKECTERPDRGGSRDLQGQL